MSSTSLQGVITGIEEVRALRRQYPVPRHGIASGTEALAAKAHGRACVVLLSSHLERYVRALNEEAIEWLNDQACSLREFPDTFLLSHSRAVVDDLAQRSWEKRGDALRTFFRFHSELWGVDRKAGELDHDQMLTWMKSPKPESLTRFFGLYGIDNIFLVITRRPRTRGALYLGMRELVEKRNNIAHGDSQTEALPMDVTRYLNAVSTFTTSADKVMARKLKMLTGAPARPW